MAKGCRWPEVENLPFAVFGEITLYSARRIVREDPLSQQKGHGRGLFLQHRSTKNNCISSLYLVHGYWPQRVDDKKQQIIPKAPNASLEIFSRFSFLMVLPLKYP